MRDGTYAVIPVKPFASAKRRLAPILNSFERAQLARLMLGDVLDSVSAARSLAGAVIVTCNRDAATMAEERSVQVILEDGEFGLACAVERGLAALSGVAKGAVVIPSDIPQLPPATIDAVVEKTPNRGVTLVPAMYDGGTNLLCLRPCHLMPALFGPDSFSRHHDAALRARATTRIHICPLAGNDLDEPRDLISFLSVGSSTRTRDFLAGLGIPQRNAALSGLSTPADFALESA
jgi:2-phospho-L-lactate guanylyltransferase